VTQPSEPPREIDIGVNAAPTVDIGKVIKNTSDDILMITTSKAELVLRDHWKQIQQSNDWQATILFLIPIALAIPTTNFDEHFGISGQVWQTLFFITVAICALWLVVQVTRRLRGGTMDAKKVISFLLEGGKQTPAASSSAPAAIPAVNDTAQTEQSPSPDHAVTSDTPDPARTESHPFLTSPSQPSSPPQNSESAVTSTGAVEPSLPPEAAPNGVRPGNQVPELVVGARVQHRNFGVGTVAGVLPGPPRRLLVRFADPDVGTKRLREDLAPLWHLGIEE
jgi:hypothetical protein